MGASVASTPVINLGAGRTALALAAGDAHTCAILDDYSVKCWGDGSQGRLGQGNTDPIGDGNGLSVAIAPTISLGTGRTAIALTAGSSHTCAVLDNGTSKCWGNGTDGRLGYGNQNSLGDSAGEMGDALPAVSLGSGRTALAISAGALHTCAVQIGRAHV